MSSCFVAPAETAATNLTHPYRDRRRSCRRTMGFLNPKQKPEDEELPGSGRSIDLETLFCPSCRRELPPWERRCPHCDVVAVPADQVPPAEVPLPPGLAALADLDDDELADDEQTRHDQAGDGTGDAADEGR
jgi:hypothetical protein